MFGSGLQKVFVVWFRRGEQLEGGHRMPAAHLMCISGTQAVSSMHRRTQAATCGTLSESFSIRGAAGCGDQTTDE